MSDEKRQYRMTRRAELEEQTRRRITESAVALHEEVGPAQTSISAIAERAGVRRSTVYRHFPDEDALFAACSSHWRAANPPPDPARLGGDRRPGRAHARRRSASCTRSTAAPSRCTTSLLRDEPLVPAVQRRLRDFYGYLGAIHDILMAGRGLRGRAARRTRAAIGHALAFPTWRSLTRRAGTERRRRRRAHVPARRGRRELGLRGRHSPIGGAAAYSSSVTWSSQVAGLPSSSTWTHREVRHEAGRARAVPVLLPGLEEDAVAGADHLDRPAAPLTEAHALEHPDRLAVRVRVPGGARAGREVDAARAHARGVRRRRDGSR